MSKTDKTRPKWVKIAERRMVTCRPQHDHRFGPCTLPDRIDAGTIGHPGMDGCWWVVAEHIAQTVHNGCRSCTGYYERREDRRRNRHESRRDLHAYRGED